ncbi:MAG: NYN domain-containing protein [Kiritimatiellia bacterium]
MKDEQSVQKLAVLIDADNVSATQAGDIFRTACSLGEPIVRRAYGMVNCFSQEGGWNKAQREYGILAKPQVSNVSGKNVADIALVIDAMELLHRSGCDGICIVSSDSDFTALAMKIREGGKHVYGIGSKKTPGSFRVACTKFFELVQVKKTPSGKQQTVSSVCPRCGGTLETTRTKSRQVCRRCPTCGGMTAKISTLKKSFAAESLAQVVARAKGHEVPGCVCPDCGASMSLVKVAAGKRQVEIDVCGKCQTVWYDKDEFESLVPDDGVLLATVSAGKAFRRELVLALAADLRSGRCKVKNIGALKTILRKVYFVPTPDINPVIGTLTCQSVIKIDKTGVVTVVAERK